MNTNSYTRLKAKNFPIEIYRITF